MEQPYMREEKENIKIVLFPQIKKSRYKKVLFDCLIGKNVIKKYNPDIVLSLQNIILFGVKQPQYLYVHQAIPFQKEKKFSFFRKNERSLALIQYIIGFFIKLSISHADKVFVQTHWMKEVILQYCNDEKQKVLVAFPNVNTYHIDISKHESNRFFYPTSNMTYKNNNDIVKACNILNKKGISDFEIRLTLPENTISHRNIKCIGQINKEQMEHEYQSGTLVFASSIETVGLPLLEARACSTLIIASDTAFSRECLYNYENAAFYSALNVEELAQRMEHIITSHQKPLEIINVSSKGEGWKKIYEEITKSSSNMH